MGTEKRPLSIRIRRASPDAATAHALADILVDVVADGASVGFVLPLAHNRALEYWQSVLVEMTQGRRIVLVAEDTATATILGTVQLVPAIADNQPHRADVAKMLVHSAARRRGIGAALLSAIENEARNAGRTLLVLDTATGSEADRLYARAGWQRSGTIPDYAYWPDGRRKCSTTVFYRLLDGPPAVPLPQLEAAERSVMLAP